MVHFDIAIVGSGIVGRNEFTKRLKVVIIDANSPPIVSIMPNCMRLSNYSNRVSSINAKSFSYLNSIASLQGHQFREIRVWDGDDPGAINLVNDTPMGFIVENGSIIKAMSEVTNGWITEYRGVVESIECDKYVVMKVGDAAFGCDLVIGADGKASTVGKFLNSRIIEKKYEQKGIVGTLRVKTNNNNNMIAYQRFLPGGPFALLPLDQDVMSMVWTLPNEIAENLLGAELDRDKWLILVKSALRLLTADIQYYCKNLDACTEDDYQWRLSKLGSPQRSLSAALPIIEDLSVKSIAAFPLSLSLSYGTVTDRAIIIGDAAHTVHPLAGQGVNLGIGDVRRLEKAIAEAARFGLDVGDIDNYRAYERERLMVVAAVAGFIEFIHRLYKPNFVLGYLRQTGMHVFDNLSWLKKVSIKVAQL